MNFIVSFLLFGLNAMFFCNKRRPQINAALEAPKL